LLTKALSKRVVAVEQVTRVNWLSRPEASCPWKWMGRFAAYKPENARHVERIVPWVLKQFPTLVREETPRVNDSAIMHGLIPICQFLHPNPPIWAKATDEALDAGALLLHYIGLKRDYEEATCDMYRGRHDPIMLRPRPRQRLTMEDEGVKRFVSQPWCSALCERIKALEADTWV